MIESDPARGLMGLVMFYGLVYLLAYSSRLIKKINWRR